LKFVYSDWLLVRHSRCTFLYQTMPNEEFIRIAVRIWVWQVISYATTSKYLSIFAMLVWHCLMLHKSSWFRKHFLKVDNILWRSYGRSYTRKITIRNRIGFGNYLKIFNNLLIWLGNKYLISVPTIYARPSWLEEKECETKKKGKT
jgi:hypothetical protein